MKEATFFNRIRAKECRAETLSHKSGGIDLITDIL